MPSCDIIVIGASAGGVQVLQTPMSQLPPDLPASVFVVMHAYPRSRSLLPEILTRAGSLPALHPEDGAIIERGRIYVAPPDHHLVVEREHIHLSRGPKEQHQRPSINVTFRSAAMNYGERVAGIGFQPGVTCNTGYSTLPTCLFLAIGCPSFWDMPASFRTESII
jgi:two-component system, chemotaxis family, protein-glutamate methylesterase/glutaminase